MPTPDPHISIPAFGIIVGLLASFIQSLGLTIQRKSHVLNQRLQVHEQRAEHRRPLWLLGFAIFISSNILGSLVQIASLPVVILAPLGAISLLWNAFFARFILGDVFSPWMILGTLLIAGGAVLIALFGIVPEPTRSLEDLLKLFGRPTFIAYFSVLGALVIVALLITHVTEYSFKRQLSIRATPPIPLPSASSPLATNATSTVTGTVTERTPLLDRKSPSPSPSLFFSRTHESTTHRHTRLLLSISYASFSGIISGMCLLFAKSGVELLLLTLRGKNQFWRWESWALVLGLVVFALLQLWYLHKALTLANPTLVCPSAFCFYNLSSIINGLVYFDQFTLIPLAHLAFVTVGIAILLGGVWVVSIQSGENGVDVGTWAEGDEGAISDGDSEECDFEVQDGNGAVDSAREREETDVVENIMWKQRERKKRETRSESNIAAVLSTSPERRGSILGLGFPSTRHSTNLPPSPSLLTSRSRSTSPRLPISRRRRPTLDGHPYISQAQTFAGSLTRIGHHSRPPSQLSVPAIGPGLQIGLSPLSPGFVIMPQRRRISGLWAGSGDGPAGGSRRHSRAEAVRRRTVSEGDLRRQAGVSEQSGEDVDQDAGDGDDISVVEVGRNDVSEQGKGKGTGKGRKGKLRWGWLRNLTRRG